MTVVSLAFSLPKVGLSSTVRGYNRTIRVARGDIEVGRIVHSILLLSCNVKDSVVLRIKLLDPNLLAWPGVKRTT
jgi:hypothetical protein